MIDPLVIAWAAGFFDGEGCVMVEMSKEARCRHKFRTSLHVTVTQTSLPCLQIYLEHFGGSIVTSNNRTPNGRRWAVQHRWVARNEEALNFLQIVEPYVIVKKEQVKAALKYPLKSPDGVKYGNKTNPIPDDVMQARVAVRALLKDIRASMKTMALPAKVPHG